MRHAHVDVDLKAKKGAIDSIFDPRLPCLPLCMSYKVGNSVSDVRTEEYV